MTRIGTLRTTKAGNTTVTLNTVHIGDVADCGIRYSVQVYTMGSRGAGWGSETVFPTHSQAAAEYRARVEAVR